MASKNRTRTQLLGQIELFLVGGNANLKRGQKTLHFRWVTFDESNAIKPLLPCSRIIIESAHSFQGGHIFGYGIEPETIETSSRSSTLLQYATTYQVAQDIV